MSRRDIPPEFDWPDYGCDHCEWDGYDLKGIPDSEVRLNEYGEVIAFKCPWCGEWNDVEP